MNAELFIQAVKAGNFDEAKKEMSTLSDKKLSDTLFLLAYDDSNICSYAFALFLLSKNNSIASHRLAMLIPHMGIMYLPCAYSAAAYHAREIFEMSRSADPTDDGGILFLCIYPERTIRRDEAIEVAQEILKYDPNDHWALRVMEESPGWVEDPLVPARNDREQLEQYIVAGKFTQAKELLSAVSTRELHAMLLYLGCEERNLCAYAFTWYLMQEKEQAELHYLAYRIVTLAYARNMNGCDAAGLFHLKRAMALEPENEKYIEHFLMLHTPPLGRTLLISDDEAEMVAKQALKKHQCSVFGQKVLEKLGRE